MYGEKIFHRNLNKLHNISHSLKVISSCNTKSSEFENSITALWHIFSNDEKSAKGKEQALLLYHRKGISILLYHRKGISIKTYYPYIGYTRLEFHNLQALQQIILEIQLSKNYQKFQI